jgi:hypothetical protein
MYVCLSGVISRHWIGLRYRAANHAQIAIIAARIPSQPSTDMNRDLMNQPRDVRDASGPLASCSSVMLCAGATFHIRTLLGSGGNWPRTRRLFGREFPMPAPEDRGGWYDELMAAGMLGLRGSVTRGYRQMARTAPLFGHTGVFPEKYPSFREPGRLSCGLKPL